MKKSIKKEISRVFVTALTVLFVMSFTSTAFATGPNLHHSGTATRGYTSSDYVSQQNDQTLKCTYGSTNRGSVIATPKFGNTSLATGKTFKTGTVFIIPKYSSLRYVRMYLGNDNQWAGTSITTEGDWYLSK